MKHIIIVVTVFILLLSYKVNGQILSGRLIELTTGEPLSQARLMIDNGDISTEVLADNDGRFTFEMSKTYPDSKNEKSSKEYLPTSGIDSSNILTIHIVEPDIFKPVQFVLKKGNNTISRDFYFEYAPLTISEISVYDRTYESGNLTMPRQQYKVMPASFQDPSRILLKYPGFSTPNDGANGIVFRGLPPESARWQLFGADIVNPNHHSNAGTASDQANLSAGGINALSGSVLGSYHFDGNPAKISNASVMSGVSNLSMANSMRPFIDINLIGLEAGFGTSINEHHFYAAYRYSFTGLLNKLGIDFGGERISYQDLSFYADVLKDDDKFLKVFGTLGESSNIFHAVDSITPPTRSKDVQNIDYFSKLTIAGAQLGKQWQHSIFNSTLVFSQREDRRKNTILEAYEDWFPNGYAIELNKHNLLTSWHNRFQFFNEYYQWEIGLRTNYHRYISNYDALKPVNEKGSLKSYYTIYPYGQYTRFLNSKMSVQAGVGVLYDNQSNEASIEPSLGWKYRPSEEHTLEINYRFATIQDFSDRIWLLSSYIQGDVRPERIKSSNLQAQWNWHRQTIDLGLNAFYHQFYNLELVTTDYGYGTPYNGGDFGLTNPYYNQFLLQISGHHRARTYGVEAYFGNKFNLAGGDFAWNVNGTVFDSRYRLPSEDHYKNAKYNYGYMSNLNLNFTKPLKSDFKKKYLIVSLSWHLRNGESERALNTNPSIDNFYAYDQWSDYNSSFRPYHRLDFRVVYSSQKFKGRLYHQWSLDIQNLLNRENDGFRYFDPLLKKIVMQPQLGLIPVISYRLEWDHR